jgi:hypothetical protein
MLNDTSVFPVALLENAVTHPIAYQGKEVCGSPSRILTGDRPHLGTTWEQLLPNGMENDDLSKRLKHDEPTR